MIRLLIACTLIASSLSISVPKRSGRIIGGWTAFPELIPYLVTVKDLPSRSHLCGGFIINNRWIGSSAYCVVDRTSANTIVVAGTTTLNSGGITYSLDEIIVHEGFLSSLRVNDVSLLHTSVTIIFNAATQPITISPQFFTGGVNVRAAGWGATESNGGPNVFPNDLQYITVQTITNADCRTRLEEAGGNFDMVFENKICTFNMEGQGTCDGDHGGPLVTNNQVIGIISWSFQCGRGHPDVHVRASSVRDWILRYTQ